MLTKLTVRNFKRFRTAEFELGERVVFVGPNNSGKTSAMQALALWEVGVKRWSERTDGGRSRRRSGVAVNRRDLLAIPHPAANLLWLERRTRQVARSKGRQTTSNIRIDVIVSGTANGKTWECGMEFDYANEESFYCRPLRLNDQQRMPFPAAAAGVNVAVLPPMSGLSATETRLDRGAMNVRIGEGRTAEVLRNLCWQIAENEPEQWQSIIGKIHGLFGVQLNTPQYIQERGEIHMTYAESGGIEFDLSCSGRGLQQTLLILSYMHANPHGVILLDEPDAHLEILRQRQIYDLIGEVASECGNQIIAASHSEVLLNEAAGKQDTVIAFVGEPHPIPKGDQGSQVRKALAEIGFDQYCQAEQTGWALYLEGSTDLAILRALAEKLGDEKAMAVLAMPFVHYVGNQPSNAARHFHGLREAFPELRGLGLYDQDAPTLANPQPPQLQWQRREIENYICTPQTLANFARAEAKADAPELDRRSQAMGEAIEEVSQAMDTLGKGDPWEPTAKVSDDFLAPLFEVYYRKLSLPNLMRKGQFHVLARHVPLDEIDPEVGEKLAGIVAVADSAKPVSP